MKEILRQHFQKYANEDAVTKAEKKVYRDLLNLNTFEDQVNGLLDFGYDHEQIIRVLIEASR